MDDIEGGVHPSYLDKAFYHSSKALEFASNHFMDFFFRGCELRQTSEGHADVANYEELRFVDEGCAHRPGPQKGAGFTSGRGRDGAAPELGRRAGIDHLTTSLRPCL